MSTKIETKNPGEETPKADAPKTAEVTRWFGPVIDALKDLDGSAKPKYVKNRIIAKLNLPEDMVNETYKKSGNKKFASQIRWAREYLKQYNLIDGSERGTWTLTEKGKNTVMTNELVKKIYKEVGNRLTTKNKENSGTLSKKNNYWIWSPGRNASKWDEFYENKMMGISNTKWEKLDDLNQYANKDAINQKIRELGGTKIPINDSLAMWEFAKVIQKGDIVFAKNGMREIIGRGVVDSEYKFDSNRDEYKHIRTVKWSNKGVWQNPRRNAPMKTLTKLKQGKDTNYIQSLEALFKGENKSEGGTALVTYSREDYLAEVFMEGTEYDRLVRLIETKKNVILQGPPGVGKTFASKRLAYSIMEKRDEKRIMMVQFHQNYSYEDFIMGFRPSKESFELNYGPFYEFCQTAKDHTDQKYFFMIDEINRGNLSKIFGELLMLIENDKRDQKLRLLYKNELFSVPRNVHLIGLMNTADRSLALMDYALRRRFAFYEMKPAFDSVGFKKIIEKFKDTKFPKLIEAVKALNEKISKDENLGEGFRIGHSFFCPGDDIGADEINVWLKSVVEFELLPLLNEYWFDEKSKIQNWINDHQEALT